VINMVSITVSVPPEIRELMLRYPEMNWSGFVKKAISEKAKELAWRDEMLKQLKEEEPITQWAVALQKKARKGRFAELKKETERRGRT